VGTIRGLKHDGLACVDPGAGPCRLPEFRDAYSNLLSSGRTMSMYPWAEPDDYDEEVSVVASQLALVPAAVEAEP